jgi:hypothetical protein
MNLELTDEQTEASIRELSLIIEYDCYRLSPRIVALKEILGMLRPEPVREPLPPRRHYEPPSKGRYGRHAGRATPCQFFPSLTDYLSMRRSTTLQRGVIASL